MPFGTTDFKSARLPIITTCQGCMPFPNGILRGEVWITTEYYSEYLGWYSRLTIIATVLISTLSECEPVIILLLVEFEPLTMGDKPVSNNTYETSVLNKIGIMEALYPDLVPPQDLLAAIKTKGCIEV